MYEGVSPSATSTSLGDGGAGSGGGSGGPSPSDKMHREVEREGQPRATQYLASNCVLFTYFSGDPASVVDEHFSRALSQPSSYSLDKPGVQKTCTRPGQWSRTNDLLSLISSTSVTFDVACCPVTAFAC